jgi:hypothetical protein
MMSDRKSYDPIEDIKDMELNKDAWIGMYSLHDAIMMFCGFLLIIGFVTNWMSYVRVDQMISYAGWDFARDAGNYPEVWLIFMLGIFFIIRPILSAYLRKSTYISVWPSPIITIIASIVGLMIPVEIFLRYAPTLKDDIGIAFMNNAGIGWYLSISASIILLIAGLLVFVESFLNKKYRDRAIAERQARFGVGYVPSEFQTYQAPPQASGGAPEMMQAPPPPQEMPQQQPAPGPMPAGGQSPFGPAPMDPKARKKYEKALKKWQEQQARRGF